MTPDVLARYADQALPRYTSYPTAPHFAPDVGASAYARWLATVSSGSAGSLYLHIPFCRSMCWYCGCHTTVSRGQDLIASYVKTLRREIEFVSQSLPVKLLVNHVHFGGGTPTLLDPSGLLGLMDLLRARFVVSAEAEIAIEIDPRTLTQDMISALGTGGITRASLGVQSFDHVVQQAIGRVQSFDATARAAEGLRRAGIRGLNFDLIYGLPHQTVASCIETVAQCLALAPDRLSVFGYAHVPSFKKHQRKIHEDSLPGALARHEQAEAIAGTLLEAGYVRIGLDHYAQPKDALAIAQAEGTLRRNFQGYTTDQAEILLGMGASAIGRLPQGYVQNEIGLQQYTGRLNEGHLPVARGYAFRSDDRFRAELIERLMCDLRVDVGEVSRRHGRSMQPIMQAFPAVQSLEQDGIISLQESLIEITPAARPLLRSVAAAFDGYLGMSGRAHSRAV
jgi:oxygen-independent coproporphyrinogen III oxidase